MATTKLPSIIFPPEELAQVLKAAASRATGLVLQVTKQGGVDVRPFLVKIKDEDFLVKNNGIDPVICVGAHQLRLCNKNVEILPLLRWGITGLHRQNGNTKMPYGNPRVTFDMR